MIIIQLNEDEIDKFHHVLINVLTLNFLRDENKTNQNKKRMPIKKMSKTQRRKIKRIHKIKAKNDKTVVDK